MESELMDGDIITHIYGIQNDIRVLQHLRNDYFNIADFNFSYFQSCVTLDFP